MSIFTFSFIDENGLGYRFQVYWESLYVFSPGDKKLLVAVRVVPHNSLFFATYLALRQQNQEPVHKKLLAEMGVETQPGTSLVESFTEIVPCQSPHLPVKVAEEVEEMLDAVMEQALTEYGTQASSNSLAVSTAEHPPPDVKYSVSTEGLGGLADLTGEDVGWVHLSNMAYRALQQQADAMRREPGFSENLPALQADLEYEISRRLYGNPQFLAFVRQVMEARGGFVSPLVRHFTAFYLRCVQEKVREGEREEGIDTAFWEERLASVIGQAEAEATYTMPHHELVVLGEVVEGEVEMDREDPDPTRRSFRLDVESLRHGIVLCEIRSRARRIFLKGYVKRHFRHHVKRVCFMDEVKQASS